MMMTTTTTATMLAHVARVFSSNDATHSSLTKSIESTQRDRERERDTDTIATTTTAVDSYSG